MRRFARHQGATARDADGYSHWLISSGGIEPGEAHRFCERERLTPPRRRSSP